MNNKLVATVAILCIALTSCKRESLVKDDINPSDNQTAQNVAAKDLVAPAGFSFKTEKQLNVRVKVTNAVAGERYGIKIYASEPTTGKLISSGATDNSGEYTNTITVPAWLEHIYIEKTNPSGNSTLEKVAANQFTAAVFKSTGNSFQKPYILRKSSGITCVSGCTRTITNPSSGSINSDSETLCINGNNIGSPTITLASSVTLSISGNITGSPTINVGNNCTVKICATGNISKIKFVGFPSTVYFLEGSQIVLATLESDYPECNVYNYSDSLRITNGTTLGSINSVFKNYGTMYFEGNVGTSSSGYNFENNGNMTFSNAWLWITKSTVVNNGNLRLLGANGFIRSAGSGFVSNSITNNNYMYVEKEVTNEFGCTINNNCQMIIGGDLNNEHIINNKGYIKVGNIYRQYAYDEATLDMHDGALITMKDLFFPTGKIKGTGTNRSIVKVSGTSTISPWYPTLPEILGNVNLCDDNGVETNDGTITFPAAISCSGSIPTSACNPIGFGVVNGDTDLDGIADNIDEYPNDATRAFNSYYPSENANATVAFEDLWPSLGDYDFNDLAVAFNIQQVLNADNKVVDYKVKLQIKAIGGSYINGLGFQLDDLVPADINTITGQVLTQNLITRNANNTEAGQAKAVVICYDSPEPLVNRVGGSMFNTIKTNGTGTADSTVININFTIPIDPTKLGLDKFNPFIFTNKRRGYEVHLPNFVPTDLANTSVLGTFADISNPSAGTYYKTANGMPWAMIIPEDFVYPKEKAAITSAYNFFDDWVLSNGTANTNWFTNIVGNRNEAEVY